jgi:hypothetical protein
MLTPLNCPFCGYEGEVVPIGWADRYAVACTNPDGCPVEAQATAGSREQAVELWNRRAPVAAQVGAA